jgi:GNAT superfamily N-acetyltransferase
MRGQGLGRRLVEAVTARADEEGMPCYLESSKGMPNLAIYERLGFEGVSEIECVDGKDICTVCCLPYFLFLPSCTKTVLLWVY